MDLIESLKRTLEETANYFDLPNEDLGRTYGKDKWSVRQILIHLADAEGVLQDRIKRVIAEPKQVIWAFHQELWCEKLDYENFPLDISKALFISNRQSIIYLAGKFYEDYGYKEFVHSQTGIRTLRDEFEKVATHNQGHLDHIKMALKAG
jgi:hypothetical protein